VTYGLYRATADLARGAKQAGNQALFASIEATKLARDEFNAAHRPELSSTVSMSLASSLGRIGKQFALSS
jgi:hypothetical protein